MDIKGMYQDEAERLADEWFDIEFYELSGELQHAVYTQAMSNVHDRLASQADMLCDRLREV